MRCTVLFTSVVLAGVVIFAGPARAASEAPYQVGLSAVDITPDYPIRLSGFGNRRTESEGVRQRIWAKAMAIADAGGKNPVVLVAVDNVGVLDAMTREVATRLEKDAKLNPARFTITSTHTHTGPMLAGGLATLFGMPIPPEHQEKIDRYTRELTDKIEQAALAALKDLQPATIEFAIGSADFAMNRRPQGGPVDHDLPVLAIKGGDGKLRGMYVSYACHCVTLSDNMISGDWAGYVQEIVQQNHPGAVAITSIGCGADANPDSGVAGDKVEKAIEQGKKIATEVDRLLASGALAPISGSIGTKLHRIDLAFDTHPTRAQWEEKAKQPDAVGYHARVQLERLDRGEKLQEKLSYPIQTWTFGDQLGVVFLPGEVVVDYSVRLKREYDRSRIWINAYANDVPCYIPSERILKEGGYEGEWAMTFYDRPTRLKTGVEQQIIDEVHRQLPESFLAPKGTEGVAPRSPEASLRSIRTKPGLEVDLVAAEPLVMSPVAIDWDRSGRMFVCEMFDYPAGTDGNWRPGGRVRRLEDSDGDGHYDKSTLFLENIPFPTGITCAGGGIYLCAAPELLYARDTDNDGKADKVETVFTGFATDNYQTRINSITLGLDNWLYVANGLLGGTIARGDGGGEKIDIRNHDFRFTRDRNTLETVTGLTQYGRVRDDWGRWFGCDNSRALLNYPHEARYLRRNPNVAAPPPIVAPPGDFDVGRIYPVSRTLERFNDADNVNRMTSASGVGVYRDTLMGEAFYGNTFTAEPVHNVVHRLSISGGDAAPMKRHRAADEQTSEFLASTDNWFRPVQVRTGPDGALYVVDMYRFLIEHPRWIPAERLAQLDIRAGADKGRIYRVRPEGKALRSVPDLTKLDGHALAAALDSPNGTERDRVHLELLERVGPDTITPLKQLAKQATTSQTRIQALAVLDGLSALDPEDVQQALADSDAWVRAHAVRLSERFLIAPTAAPTPGLGQALLRLAEDDSPLVRRQLAFTLGEWGDDRAGKALGKLAAASLDDAEMRVAILSSALRHCGEVLSVVMAEAESSPGRNDWIPPLVATAAASGDDGVLGDALVAVLPAQGAAMSPHALAALASLCEALSRKQTTLSAYLAERPELSDAIPRLAAAREAARRSAKDDEVDDPSRQAALRVIASDVTAEDVKLLCDLASLESSEPVRSAAMNALSRQQGDEVASELLSRWPQMPTSIRPEVVNLLLGREAWTAALLAAVKKRTIQPNEIPLTDRQRLAASGSESIAALAAQVFGERVASARSEVVSQYETVAALQGNASQGAELFAKNCSACHALAGIGKDVGPSLSALRDKEVDYFVKNILDPNAIIEPRFVNYVINTNDRRQLSGIITSETSTSVTLASGGAATVETVDRAAVKDIRATSISMMPEGFESAFSPQQLADLIAFIKTSAARKTIAGNAPETVKQSANDGSVMLSARSAEIYGQGPIVFESEYGNIGYWHGADDYVAWSARIDRAGEYDVYLDYACPENSAGNSFVLGIADQTLTGTIAATGSDWTRYEQSKAGIVMLPAGEQRLTVRPEGALKQALMDLRAVALVPKGVKPAWKLSAPAKSNPPAGDVARTPADVAKVILDASRPNAEREAIVNANPQYAADLIVELTRDLKPGTPVEYERIPWIWRIAIACGRRNDAGQVRRVLDVSLPRDEQPLHDWQAVVIGGGIINGISQQDVWPGQRVSEILEEDKALRARWTRAIDLASVMADNEKVPHGTRYDALRMLGVEPWEKRGEQLVRYLTKETHAELQMGAVSGLADVDSPQAASALLAAIPGLTEGNRKLAIDAMLRSDMRMAVLLDAVAARTFDRGLVEAQHIEQLLNAKDSAIRQRAKELFNR